MFHSLSLVLRQAPLCFQDAEIDRLQATIRQLEERQPVRGEGGRNVVVDVQQHQELEKLRVAYDKLYADYRTEQTEKLEAWDALEALQAPQAVGGSFKRVLAVVEAAAAVTDAKNEWSRDGCEELVVEMVKGMLSKKEAEKPAVVRELTVKVCLLCVHISIGYQS